MEIEIFYLRNLKYFQCSPCRPSATCTDRPCCWPCRSEWRHGLVVTSRTEESPGTSAGSSPGLGLSSWWVNDHDDHHDYLNVSFIMEMKRISESTSVKYTFYTPKYVYLFQFAIEEKQRERNISNLKINYKQSFALSEFSQLCWQTVA